MSVVRARIMVGSGLGLGLGLGLDLGLRSVRFIQTTTMSVVIPFEDCCFRMFRVHLGLALALPLTLNLLRTVD